LRARIVGKCCNRVERSTRNSVASMLGYGAFGTRDTVRSVLLAGVEGNSLRVEGDIWSDGARTAADTVVGESRLV